MHDEYTMPLPLGDASVCKSSGAQGRETSACTSGKMSAATSSSCATLGHRRAGRSPARCINTYADEKMDNDIRWRRKTLVNRPTSESTSLGRVHPRRTNALTVAMSSA